MTEVFSLLGLHSERTHFSQDPTYLRVGTMPHFLLNNISTF